jgi:hypothetical protein
MTPRMTLPDRGLGHVGDDPDRLVPGDLACLGFRSP